TAGDADATSPSPLDEALSEVDTLLVRSVQLCKDLTGLWSPLVLYESGLVAALRMLSESNRSASDGLFATDRSVSESAVADDPYDEGPDVPDGPLPSSLTVEVDCDDDAEPATQDGRTLLYQAAIELLSNVAKHAGVDRARLTLRRRNGSRRPDRLCLTVTDEGCGFDAPPLTGPAEPAGAGGQGDEASGGGGFIESALALHVATDRFGLFSLAERLRLADGRLEIESVAGRGTVVRLLLPVNAGLIVQRPLFADSPPHAPADPADMHVESDSDDGVSPIADTPAPPVRVLLADDHRIIRLSLAGLLGRAEGVEVIGEAVDGEDALQKAEELRPDVVLMDVNMPRLDGVEATRRLKERWPDTRVIALSMHESDDREFDMFEAGAEQYVVKDGPPEQLLRAVRGDALR
ncbi:MAG: response regulator, partial [Planctomycetota bacterium]